MTQAEVMNILEKSKKEWLSAREISEKLGKTSSNTIRLNLYKLFNQGILLKKTEGESFYKHFVYKLK